MISHVTIEDNVFLQQSDYELEGARSASPIPEADAYESQNGKIIAMMEKLLDKFVRERTVLEKEKMVSKHGHRGPD